MRKSNPQDPAAVRLGCTILAVVTLLLIAIVAMMGAPSHAEASAANGYRALHRLAERTPLTADYPSARLYQRIARTFGVRVEDQAGAVAMALRWDGAQRRVRFVQRALNGHGY